MQTRAWKIIT